VTTEGVQVSSELPAVRDHARQFRELTRVYPVISRRSGGLSLGVNLNPDKQCNFHCVYCGVDRRVPGHPVPVNAERVREELTALVRTVRDGGLSQEERFRDAGELARVIKDIAFSGDGEPTLVPAFSDCVEAVADVRRQEKLLDTKIVLITNSTCLDREYVKKGLDIMNANQGEVWAKLDAGTDAWFKRMNRSPIGLDHIVANIAGTARVRPIVIQSLFARVRGETMSEQELHAYCDRLNEVVGAGGQIKEVHAYTTARPVSEPGVERLTAEEIEAVARVIRDRTTLRVRSFA